MLPSSASGRKSRLMRIRKFKLGVASHKFAKKNRRSAARIRSGKTRF